MLSRDEEKRFIADSQETIYRVTGQKPIGWNAYWLRNSVHILETLQELGFLYSIDEPSHDEPFIIPVKGKDFVTVPYTFNMNDISSFPFEHYNPMAYEQTLKDEFDQLYEEGSSRRRLMLVGFHDRINGHPSRVRALDRFFTYARSHEGVWFAQGRDREVGLGASRGHAHSDEPPEQHRGSARRQIQQLTTLGIIISCARSAVGTGSSRTTFTRLYRCAWKRRGMSTLKGKKILVVGGSSGIGLATAKAAVAEGAAVTIASRDKAGIEAAIKELEAPVDSATVDLVDNKTILALFDRLSSFDHLVVTAASTKTGTVRSLALDDAYASMDSKFWGAYRLAKAAKLNDGGSMTFVSGFLSHRPNPKAVLQGAINAAVEGLVRGLALEFAPLRVNAVSPGLIDTTLYAAMPADAKADMLAKAKDKLPVHRVGAADDVAQAILMLGANPYITGSTIVVDGGGSIAL